MSLWIQILLVAAITLAVFAVATALVARLLRLSGPRAHVAATVVRFSLAVALAIGLAASRLEHRIALVFTVGAAYFAAALFDGLRRFRQPERNECRTR